MYTRVNEMNEWHCEYQGYQKVGNSFVVYS